MAAPRAAAARRYGKALFGLASEEGRIEEIRAELDRLAELLGASPELARVLLSPLHPAPQRRNVFLRLAERLALSPILRNFGAFLIDQRRASDFDAIHAEYVRLAEEALGRVSGEVVSASPLSEAQVARLREALGRRTGREVALAVRVDPALLGGAVARVGDLVFDGSLRTQLEQLRANLTGGR
jgi:F-type H+-transporting ATPase subunit delta